MVNNYRAVKPRGKYQPLAADTEVNNFHIVNLSRKCSYSIWFIVYENQTSVAPLFMPFLKPIRIVSALTPYKLRHDERQ